MQQRDEEGLNCGGEKERVRDGDGGNKRGRERETEDRRRE